MSWTRLPDELKQDAIGLLDYESRCNLRICSKSDKDIVDSTKVTAKKLTITETSSEMSEGKTIIRIDIDTFTIWFIGKENLTRIDRGWNDEIIDGFSDIKQKNRYELIEDFFERFKIDRVKTFRVFGAMFPIPDAWNIKFDSLKLFNMEMEHGQTWLRKCLTLCPKLKKLNIGGWTNDEELTRMIGETVVTKSFALDDNTDLTDEEIEMIEAQDLKLVSTSVTGEAVKKRLERFLKFGQKGDELNVLFQLPDQFDALEQIIPKSLILKKSNEKRFTPEDGEFFGKIMGGFENVHGVQDPREIECQIFGHLIQVTCNVYEEKKKEYELYPF